MRKKVFFVNALHALFENIYLTQAYTNYYSCKNKNPPAIGRGIS